MNAVVQLVAALLFLSLGIVFASGKGASLIAGYNTLSEREKARFDEKKLLRGMSRIMFGCALCVALGLVGTLVGVHWLVTLSFVLLALCLVFYLIYLNRSCKG